jgi:hypothetical protein
LVWSLNSILLIAQKMRACVSGSQKLKVWIGRIYTLEI